MHASKLFTVFSLAATLCVPIQFRAQSQDQPGDQPSDQKVMTDPAEYNAYIAALNTLDPVQKAAALEAFLAQFPNSIVNDDALRVLLDAYAAAHNQMKVEETTWRILKQDPDAVRAQSLVPTPARSDRAPEPEPPPEYWEPAVSVRTPCTIAVDIVKNGPDALSWDDWEYVLTRANCSPTNKHAADQVWQKIQELEHDGQRKIGFDGLVVSATKNTLKVAVLYKNQQSKQADLTVRLEHPLLKPPVPGATILVDGVITGYTPQPFMFIMEKGVLAEVKAEQKPSAPLIQPGTGQTVKR